MKPFALLCIMALAFFGLSACTKQYTSTALMEYSSHAEQLHDIDTWFIQQDSNLPDGVTLTRLRQSRLLQIQSTNSDPQIATQQANEVAMNLKKSSQTQGFSVKLVDAATSSH